MVAYTHNNTDDTTLYRDEETNNIGFMFVNDNGSVEHHTFGKYQDELFWMLGGYFDFGTYAETFDALTLPAQDALWGVLLRMNQLGEEV